MAEVTHHRWKDIEPEQMNPLTTRQFVVGTNTMMARLTLKKGAVVPRHQHRHEQITNLVEGALHFQLDGREMTVRAGEVVCIPPHAPHEVVALEDSVVLEVFNPAREDWLQGNDAYLRSQSAGRAGE
jgi:quercetin dioxygenase-like cupin family protein